MGKERMKEGRKIGGVESRGKKIIGKGKAGETI